MLSACALPQAVSLSHTYVHILQTSVLTLVTSITQYSLKTEVVFAEDLSKRSEELHSQDVDSRQPDSKEVGCIRHDADQKVPSLGLQMTGECKGSGTMPTSKGQQSTLTYNMKFSCTSHIRCILLPSPAPSHPTPHPSTPPHPPTHPHPPIPHHPPTLPL